MSGVINLVKIHTTGVYWGENITIKYIFLVFSMDILCPVQNTLTTYHMEHNVQIFDISVGFMQRSSDHTKKIQKNYAEVQKSLQYLKYTLCKKHEY